MTASSSSDMMCKESSKHYRSACNCHSVLSYSNGIVHFITNLKEAEWSSLINWSIQPSSNLLHLLQLFYGGGITWCIFRWLVSILIRFSDPQNLEYRTVVIFDFVISAVCFSYFENRLKLKKKIKVISQCLQRNSFSPFELNII